jgi:arginyl-tRNA synthetase
MPVLLARIALIFQAAIKQILPSLSEENVIRRVQIQEANQDHGDYQCNSAMGLFKDFGEELGIKNPRDFGMAVVANIDKDVRSMFKSIDVAPQGFINLSLTDEFLEGTVKQSLMEGIHYTPTEPPKKVLIDYSSPNIAKDMHVGHLRSTIIGESIARLLEFAGHQVERVNHLGDWGTQFGMLIEYMTLLNMDTTADRSISDLQNFYKGARTKFESDEDFKKRAQLMVVKLQSGDKEAKAAWKVLCDISREAFSVIYDRLDVHLVERGESFYNDMIMPVVEELREKGLLQESEGAQCVFTSVEDNPLMAVKADGGFGYDSTDLAAAKYRLVTCENDWVVILTDAGQSGHFKQIFEAADRAGWTEGGKRMDHLGLGMVQGEDGKKFKTRSGQTVKLIDLLNIARDRAKAELVGRVKEGASSLNPKEIEKAALVIGTASVKYFDLKQSRSSDYQFDFDRMLDPKGNTAVYLLYAYARISSILAKSSDSPQPDTHLDSLKLEHKTERALALELAKFPDVISMMVNDLYLHRLPEYMWSLANKFSSFYKDCKIIGSPEQASRILLVQATKNTLQTSFYLLGIEPLEKM